MINNMVMQKIKSTLQAQLGETKKVSDDECKERGFLLGKYRNQEHEVDLTREQLEEEAQSKADALRLLSKSVGEAQMWRQKYEKDGRRASATAMPRSDGRSIRRTDGRTDERTDGRADGRTKWLLMEALW